MHLAEPITRRWTRDEYYQMDHLGMFHGQRVQLIDGEIVQMGPQGHAHAVAVSLAEEALRAAFGPGFWIRVQMPLAHGTSSEPEPDLAVVSGSPRDYNAHPASALLVVEVSDATLRFDSRRKANLYASAGIADYWIINLVDHRLDVFRQPIPDETATFGHSFVQVTQHVIGDTVRPLAVPDAEIAVKDLLP